MNVISLTDSKAFILSTGVFALSAAVLWSNKHVFADKPQEEDFVRTLDIHSSDQGHSNQSQGIRAKAKIDTGADHSIISQEIVEKLGLLQETLSHDDPSSVLLPDDSLFKFRGKVTVCFHVIDSPIRQPMFRFDKYEYKATFFVPADTDISSFDAYIGKDLISKHHLQSSYFFGSKDTTTPVNKIKGRPLAAGQHQGHIGKRQDQRNLQLQDYGNIFQHPNNRDAIQQAGQAPPWTSHGQHQYNPNNRSASQLENQRSGSQQQHAKTGSAPRAQMQVDDSAQRGGGKSSSGCKCIIL